MYRTYTYKITPQADDGDDHATLFEYHYMERLNRHKWIRSVYRQDSCVCTGTRIILRSNRFQLFSSTVSALRLVSAPTIVLIVLARVSLYSFILIHVLGSWSTKWERYSAEDDLASRDEYIFQLLWFTQRMIFDIRNEANWIVQFSWLTLLLSRGEPWMSNDIYWLLLSLSITKNIYDTIPSSGPVDSPVDSSPPRHSLSSERK